MSQFGFGIGVDAVQFFDRKAVIDALGRSRVRVMSKYGAEIRRIAQRSLQYEDGPSQPGTPPHAHRSIRITKTDRKTGQLRKTKAGKVRMYAVSPLREFLFFAFDLRTETVVVGPAKLRTKRGDAPRALETGGTSVVSTKRGAGTRTVRIRRRPFMEPAVMQSTSKDFWRNSVRP